MNVSTPRKLPIESRVRLIRQVRETLDDWVSGRIDDDLLIDAQLTLGFACRSGVALETFARIEAVRLDAQRIEEQVAALVQTLTELANARLAGPPRLGGDDGVIVRAFMLASAASRTAAIGHSTERRRRPLIPPDVSP